VPIPEGQVIVRCPFCDQRSLVQGETGVQRYQLDRRVDRDQAAQSMRQFLTGHRAIAGDAAKNSTLLEAFIAYLPFWTGWARVMAWVFGQKQVGSGDNKRYEAREIRVVQDMTWNGAACDVGEFGVNEVPLTNQPLLPFDADKLHSDGMVFEPVGSASDARQSAEASYQARVQSEAKLDRVGQTFIRYVRKLMGLVYYPMWVLRYQYRGRSFQIVVDGYSGKPLFGKAPGNTLYRAAMLLGGAILGSFLAVDVSAVIFYIASQSNSDSAGGLFVGGVVALAAGFALIFAAYRAFRYGEEYEYRSGKTSFSLSSNTVISQIKDVESWIDRFS
jgi:hypothetical protein